MVSTQNAPNTVCQLALPGSTGEAYLCSDLLTEFGEWTLRQGMDTTEREGKWMGKKEGKGRRNDEVPYWHLFSISSHGSRPCQCCKVQSCVSFHESWLRFSIMDMFRVRFSIWNERL